jgi:hypothetical protein
MNLCLYTSTYLNHGTAKAATFDTSATVIQKYIEAQGTRD